MQETRNRECCTEWLLHALSASVTQSVVRLSCTRGDCGANKKASATANANEMSTTRSATEKNTL
jgi:hypothetical protein